jgi:thiamine pyrophosphokinase
MGPWGPVKENLRNLLLSKYDHRSIVNIMINCEQKNKGTPMQLPSELGHHTQWVLVGPMGPALPSWAQAYPVLAIDGGARHCPRMQIWIGDGDSNPETIECAHKFLFSPHKDQSDLALALGLLSHQQKLTLHCWGLLGGRRDHELLNLGESLHFLQTHPGSRGIFYDHSGALAVECLGPGEWEINREGVFSLVSFHEVRVKMTGDCTYPITQESLLLPVSSRGLSNWGRGKIHLTIDGAVMLIYSEATCA